MDTPWEIELNHRFGLTTPTGPGALQRFVRPPLIGQIWPETFSPEAAELNSFFILRQSRYVSETIGSNKLAELDLYLRHSTFRIPALEAFGSDAFRDSIADRAPHCAATPPEQII